MPSSLHGPARYWDARDSVVERQLNFPQIVLWVAIENQARAFDVNFAHRMGEVELSQQLNSNPDPAPNLLFNRRRTNEK
jgi:hypothetical protein